MPSRPVTRTLVLALAAGAIAASPAAAGATTLQERFVPRAAPPNLPVLSASGLAEIRRAEAAEARRSAYHLPPGAPYSNAEWDAFALAGLPALADMWRLPVERDASPS
jgi:hypothetical protein